MMLSSTIPRSASHRIATVLSRTTPRPSQTSPYDAVPCYTAPHPHGTATNCVVPQQRHTVQQYGTKPSRTTPYCAVQYRIAPHSKDNVPQPRYIVQCSMIPRRVLPYHAVPHRTVPNNIISYHTVPYHTTPYRAMPYRAVWYHAVPYHAVPYHAEPNQKSGTS